jgi:hypothetical protein
VGISIVLNKDSSFVLKNCGTTAKGNWLLNNDTIMMETFSNRFNNDSLNKARGPLKTGKKGPRYLVVKNELHYLYNDTFMGKKIINTLGRCYRKQHILVVWVSVINIAMIPILHTKDSLNILF